MISAYTTPPEQRPISSAPQPEGVAEVPKVEVPHGDALQALLDRDPFGYTTQDLDAVIAYERSRREALARGDLKKGQRKIKAKPKKAQADADPEDAQVLNIPEPKGSEAEE